MKATVKGKVLTLAIVEPKPGSNAKTKYLAAIHQPGEQELLKVEVDSAKYQTLKEGQEVEFPVIIGAWKTERSYGLNVRHA